MKRIIFILIVSCVFISCKKNDEIAPSITGPWEWYQTGGLGGISSPQTTGKTMQITFNADHTFTQAGTLYNAENGTYSLSYTQNSQSNEPDLVIMNFSSGIGGLRFIIQGDMLVSDSGPATCQNDYYKRVSTNN